MDTSNPVFIPDPRPGAKPGDTIVIQPDDRSVQATKAQDQDPVSQAEKLSYIRVPQPSEAMFYGTIGDWSRQATETSEASRVAVFLNFAVYAGACFGREASLWLGDTEHHSRLFWLHVGRTSRGRKGTAIAPVERLRHALESVDDVAARLSSQSTNLERKAPGYHDGGLSTREGLAWRIRDPAYEKDQKTGELVETDLGVKDKRLFVSETEFENVLVQSSRDGNTLSSALRDCWDGRTLAPLTKTNRTKATDPHVSLVAHITPSELLTMLKDRQITNGFLNRFIVCWAERSKIVAFPEPTPKDTIEQWASALYEAIVWCRENKREITLNPEARALYETTYTTEWSQSSANETIDALLERAPVVALRLALTLAILDQQSKINADHLHCAIAWTRYWRESVEYIWRDRVRLSQGNGQDVSIRRNAAKIIEYLQTNNGTAYRTELITECFQRHLRVAELDLALEFLQLQTPPRIVTTRVPRKGKPNQFSDVVKLHRDFAKNPCEPGECGEPEATARAWSHSHASEPGEPETPDSPHSQACEPGGDRLNTPHSPHSPHSPYSRDGSDAGPQQPREEVRI